MGGIIYGVLNNENVNKIIDRVKTKADGVYTFRRVFYRVKDFKVTHFASQGEILEFFGGFNVTVGHYTKDIEAKLLLKGI